MKEILIFLKQNAILYMNLLKEKFVLKIFAIAAIIGILTFSAWSAFFLAALTSGVWYLLKKKNLLTFLGFLNFNLFDVVINVVSGLVFACLLLLIL